MAQVLIADDEPIIQMSLAATLEDARHAAILARAGADLLEDLHRHRYDVVVTDLNMPQVSGWDVARWVEQHRPGVPVIAISGRIVEGLDEIWLKRFAAFFSKPVDEPGLLAAIARCATPPERS